MERFVGGVAHSRECATVEGKSQPIVAQRFCATILPERSEGWLTLLLDYPRRTGESGRNRGGARDETGLMQGGSTTPRAKRRGVGGGETPQ